MSGAIDFVQTVINIFDPVVLENFRADLPEAQRGGYRALHPR